MTSRPWLRMGARLAVVMSVGTAAAQEAAASRRVLKAAMIGEPPTLDTHTTTDTIAFQIAWHMVETLYTYDRQYAPIPHLAEGHTVSDGGRRYTITLRKGVKFHNGKELTAADAAASLTRWGRLHVTGKTIFKTIEAVEARDSHTLVIHLKEPSGSLLYALGSPYVGIYPKAVVDAPGIIPQGPSAQAFASASIAPTANQGARFKDMRRDRPTTVRGRRPPRSTRSLLPVPACVAWQGGERDYHFRRRLSQTADRLKANARATCLSSRARGSPPEPNHKQG